LRAQIPEALRRQSKRFAAKQGYYLTADYSVKPAQLALTKEPTKYSRWQFEFVTNLPKGYTYDHGYYIKNVNDVGAAWLVIGDAGTRYAHFIGYKFILSAEKKTVLTVHEAEGDDDGK